MSNNRGFKECRRWDFSGGSVMGLYASTARGTSLIPGQRSKIPHASRWQDQKNKLKKEV